MDAGFSKRSAARELRADGHLRHFSVPDDGWRHGDLMVRVPPASNQN